MNFLLIFIIFFIYFLFTYSFPISSMKSLKFISQKVCLRNFSSVKPGHVYVVSIPLGNRGDITERAKEVLSQVDIISAEDTRTAKKFLRSIGLEKRFSKSSIDYSRSMIDDNNNEMNEEIEEKDDDEEDNEKNLNISYSSIINSPLNKVKIFSHHQHSQRESINHLVSLVKVENQSMAIISDAGTPCISDPGGVLVDNLAKNQIEVHPVPGPSALISALSVSGYNIGGGSDQYSFQFLGFGPVKGKERRGWLENIINYSHINIFYEAPHRILRTLNDLIELNENFNQRNCICCRELTKKHEEIKRGNLKEIIQWLNDLEDKKKIDGIGIRGEFTVILGPSPLLKVSKSRLLDEDIVNDSYNSVRENENIEDENLEEMNSALDDSNNRNNTNSNNNSSSNSLRNNVIKELEDAKMKNISRSQAVKAVSKKFSVSKSAVYEIALNMNW